MKNQLKIFITGGISSGKSKYAEEQALSGYKRFFGDSGNPDYSPLHFIATAKFSDADEEMALKVQEHKRKRPAVFVIHENFNDIQTEIDIVYKYFKNKTGIILIDSLTLWLSSIFKNTSDFDFAYESVLKLSKYLKEIRCSVITVADSLGFNMVPADVYLRKFIELNGLMEQAFSALSEKAYCVIAGNPVPLK
ncbi:MAG: bifunctional adenosylcobinamide kinase/adenosylcobinamide-phosphate guanylyltransferase [Deltaproteobacteria bacterium]|nr:bifunctional adenosylcobinamide kinase/adenosylcobinamide-phosphate guanylyltransferase [Deltaproteobacteria bacterium]